MKGGGLYKFRVKKLSLSLIALLCFSFAMWAWDQIPLLTTLLPPSDEADNLFISSPVISKRSPSRTQKPKYSHQQSFTMDAQSDSSTKTNISANANSEQSHYQRISYEQTVDEDNLKMVTSKTQKSKNSHQQSFTMDAQSDSSTKTNISANAYSEQSHYQGSSYEHTVDEDNLKMVTSEKKECNYGKGKWVADNRRPLYSGFDCKQWLAEGWSCRLSTRKDFSFENYRWQPNDCEMPDFVGSNFLRRMQHKTVAIVGDSLGRQQFQSLLCMVTGGRDYPEVEDIGRQFGFLMAPGDLRPNGWAYRFPKTNTTILYHWSASLCEIEPINQTDPNTNYAMHLDRPARFLQQFLDKLDVLVLNTGHHWNRGKLNANKWVMYVNGTPNTNRKVAQIWNAKELTIRSVVKWLDSQIERIPKSKVFFRTISPRHFVNGDWNTGGSCDSTVALAGGSEVTQDRSSDPVIEDAVKGTRVKLLDITALSQLRDEGHISKFKSPQGGYDCLHWCLPGIPDTWNEILAAQV